VGVLPDKWTKGYFYDRFPFERVLAFLLYKLQWYKDHEDEALSWLLKRFAPVGAMISTVAYETGNCQEPRSQLTGFFG